MNKSLTNHFLYKACLTLTLAFISLLLASLLAK
jgi:hypothetical protein